jgi:hypothetical protein
MQERMMSLSDRALEMVMLDVLDGLEELALLAALGSGNRGFQVLSISERHTTAARAATRTAGGTTAQILVLDDYRRAVGG